MPETTYTYDVTNDTANGQVQSFTLTNEVDAAFVTAIVRIDVIGGTRQSGGVLSGGTMDIVMADSVVEATLDAVVAAHQGQAVDQETTAEDYPYDNSNSTLVADNLPGAIDELDAGKADLQHADSHIKDGYDEIDGDQIDIDFTPSNYTPSTSPPEVTDEDHLSAHLAGIDAALTGGGGGLTEEQHKTLRQLIHFIDDGPAEGFTSGAFREILPSNNPFPTSIIWWESSSKINKIVEKTITRNANKTPSTIEWKVYDTDGSTVLATITDSITYGLGIFELNRTRTIA